MEDAVSINSASVKVLRPTNVAVAGSVDASKSNGSNGAQRPDAKTRRYDRQLRLWGASGQGGLEGARVLLINPNATGCQSLKNLVLPGIGHFTVLSPSAVTPQGVGSNFFLTPSSIGLPIAEETVKYLCELNPSVEGVGKVADVHTVLEEAPAWFLNFTLIIACNLPAATEDRLSALLWAASDTSSTVMTSLGAHPDIPLILARSSGFMGLVRLQVREHAIVDTHPTSLTSLRIDNPFPSLLEYCNSVDFDALDSMEHGNVPYVVILVRALQTWKETHNGEAPKWSGQRSNKKEFLQQIDQSRRHGDEENYAEAAEKAYLACQVTKVPSEIQALFNDSACENVTHSSKNFWLLVRALRSFVASSPSRNTLPVSSALPDMKADTAGYVALQTVYKQQAKRDLEEVKLHLANVLAEVGLEGDAVAEAEVEEFVRNASHLKVVRGRSLEMERRSDVKRAAILSFSPDPTWNVPYIPPPIVQYIAFRALDSLGPASPSATPDTQLGVLGTDPEAREGEVVARAEAFLREVAGWTPDAEEEGGEGLLPESVRNACGEIVRANGSELATTAAFLGGIVAQEVIKLLTAQYVPLDNTVIVDLIRGSTAAHKL